MNYKVVKEIRSSILISVKNGEIIVRAPKTVSDEYVSAFVCKHRRWIANRLEAESKQKERLSLLDSVDLKTLRCEASEYFENEAKRYSDIMGLKYGRIKITSAKKRLGSCNSDGTICFSYMLMLYPEYAREYVVVHELAHLVEMNHSKRFYKIIERVMPDYKKRKALFK